MHVEDKVNSLTERRDRVAFLHDSGLLGIILLVIMVGILHGLTPHGHSWLVLLPFALGGVRARVMLRFALAFSLGMLLAAAAAGAFIGFLTSKIPDEWHHGLEFVLGGVLAVVGLLFLVRPLSVHHAIDHLCTEECHPGEERVLLKSGTTRALFLVGVMSVLLPCPTNVWVYTLPVAAKSISMSMLILTIYAFFSGATITTVAILMVRARKLVESLDQRGHRLLILRFSGIIVLAMGLWLVWHTWQEHRHESHTARAAVIRQAALPATPARFSRV